MAITLKETNDFPPQVSPLIGFVCRSGSRSHNGLLLTAVDEDLPPQAAPFLFQIPDDLSANWTITQVNGKEQQEAELMVVHLGACYSYFL